jgi:hypothetical protein
MKTKWTQQGLPTTTSQSTSQATAFLPVSSSAPPASSLSFSIFVDGDSEPAAPINPESSFNSFSVPSVNQKDNNNGGLKNKPTGFGKVKGEFLSYLCFPLFLSLLFLSSLIR